MAKGGRQPTYKISPTSGAMSPQAQAAGLTNEQIDALNRLQDAEQLALEDFHNNLISAKEWRNRVRAEIDSFKLQAGLNLKAVEGRKAAQEALVSAEARALGRDPGLPMAKAVPPITLTPDPSAAQNYGKFADALAPGVGRPAYEAGRIARYGGSIGQAGGLSGIGKTFQAAGGGSAGLAAAAGPIGAVVAIADMAADKLAANFSNLGRAADFTGQTLQKIASNDGRGALTTATEGVAGFAEQIPIVGKVWAAEMRAASKVVNAFGDTVNAFVGRGKELKQYSGQIAGASAQADVRKLLADVREARELGGDYARLITAQSKLDETMQDMLVQVKKLIIPLLTAGVSTIGKVAETVNENSSSIISKIPAILGFLTPIPGLGLILAAIAPKIEEYLENEKNKLKRDQINALLQLDDLIAQAGFIDTNTPDKVDPAIGAKANKLGVPILWNPAP